jgi:D-alanyl-D-alanine-carboxypeptidase/D-alanyl-D-alanine-endopeptidase
MKAPIYRRIVFPAAGAACLLGCLWVGCLGISAEPADQHADLARLIDGSVANAPGCMGLAIGVEHQAALAERFYGDTGNHGRPNADTEFGIGSITKTFTATLLAHEDQQGDIRLNEPLARYAPPGTQVPSYHGQPILMLHLADHTSGLPRRVPNIGPPLMPEAMWRFAGSYQLSHPPGEQYLYSNLGYGLLARAIVRHMRSTEDQAYTRIITTPLGMTDTAIDLTAAQRARLAQGYLRNGSPATETAPGFPAMAGAGAVHSTLRDMMRYLDFELGKIQQPLTSLLPAMHRPYHAKGSDSSVGLGWEMRNRPDGTSLIFKDGAVPGYSAFIVFAPSSQTGAVVLANQAGCPVVRIGMQLMRGMNAPAAVPVDHLPRSDEEE